VTDLKQWYDDYGDTSMTGQSRKMDFAEKVTPKSSWPVNPIKFDGKKKIFDLLDLFEA
jgi:hypothetical protein